MFSQTIGTDSKLKNALVEMNQTDSEKEFLISYAKTYQMATANVPLLIPQAWIQWHSDTKKNLRERDSSYEDNVYRIDFVAFWKNKRFAILVDDITHYAKEVYHTEKGKKVHDRWDADEQQYSKRLKEDRKLRKEGWNVFRVSNWEIRHEQFVSEILVDLKEFIGF